MKVAIVGSGAIGLLIASFCSNSNIETILYTNRVEQADEINQNGVGVHRNGSSQSSKVQAYPFKQGIAVVDLIIVTVKQYQLQPIIDYLVETNHSSPILFLQNGMSHIYEIPRLCTNTILLGVVEHGALKTSDSTIEHTGLGQIKIGCFRGNYKEVEPVLVTLENTGYTLKIEQDWYPILIQKLVVNAVINPLTVLYNVRNGLLLENPYYFTNMQLVFQEIQSVITLSNPAQYWDNLVTICEKTSSNYSSMYMDIKHNRRTEVDSILGYLLTEGKKADQSLPLISFLYQCIKGKEYEKVGQGNG